MPAWAGKGSARVLEAGKKVQSLELPVWPVVFLGHEEGKQWDLGSVPGHKGPPQRPKEPCEANEQRLRLHRPSFQVPFLFGRSVFGARLVHGTLFCLTGLLEREQKVSFSPVSSWQLFVFHIRQNLFCSTLYWNVQFISRSKYCSMGINRKCAAENYSWESLANHLIFKVHAHCLPSIVAWVCVCHPQSLEPQEDSTRVSFHHSFFCVLGAGDREEKMHAQPLRALGDKCITLYSSVDLLHCLIITTANIRTFAVCQALYILSHLGLATIQRFSPFCSVGKWRTERLLS